MMVAWLGQEMVSEALDVDESVVLFAHGNVAASAGLATVMAACCGSVSEQGASTFLENAIEALLDLVNVAAQA
jgi:hypothetical protein